MDVYGTPVVNVSKRYFIPSKTSLFQPAGRKDWNEALLIELRAPVLPNNPLVIIGLRQRKTFPEKLRLGGNRPSMCPDSPAFFTTYPLFLPE